MCQIIEWYPNGLNKTKSQLTTKTETKQKCLQFYDFEKFGLQKYLIIRIQNYSNLVSKNWADIESRSKHKQMVM